MFIGVRASHTFLSLSVMVSNLSCELSCVVTNWNTATLLATYKPSLAKKIFIFLMSILNNSAALSLIASTA